VSAGQLLGLLAEPQRLRVLAALVLGARTTDEVAERAGLDARAVLAALARLEQGGLVAADAGGWSVREERFQEAARAARPAPAGPDDEPNRVLRAFVRDGRLTTMPVSRSKRLVVLDHIVRVFEPGRRYPEREVDTLLRAFHPDYAALRRYLIDEDFMAREAGVYWRTGGTFEV